MCRGAACFNSFDQHYSGRYRRLNLALICFDRRCDVCKRGFSLFSSFSFFSTPFPFLEMAYQQVRLSRSCRFIRSIVVVAAAADVADAVAAVVSVCFSDALLIDPVRLRKTIKKRKKERNASLLCLSLFTFFTGVCGGH